MLEDSPGYKIKRIEVKDYLYTIIEMNTGTATVGNETKLIRPNEYIKMGD